MSTYKLSDQRVERWKKEQEGSTCLFCGADMLGDTIDEERGTVVYRCAGCGTKVFYKLIEIRLDVVLGYYLYKYRAPLKVAMLPEIKQKLFRHNYYIDTSLSAVKLIIQKHNELLSLNNDEITCSSHDDITIRELSSWGYTQAEQDVYSNVRQIISNIFHSYQSQTCTKCGTIENRA